MGAKMSKIQIVWFKDLERWDFRSNHFTNDIFSNSHFPLVRIGNFLFRNKTSINIQSDEEYKRVTIRTKGQGVFLRDVRRGYYIGTKKQFLIRKGQFLISKIDARNGAFGVVGDDVDKAVITGNFWAYDIDSTKVNAHFLALLTTMSSFIEFCESCSGGTTGRHYLDENKFLNAEVPLPPLEIQQEIVNKIQNIKDKIKALQEEEKRLKEEIEAYIYIALGLERKEQREKQKRFVVRFKDLERWDITYNQGIDTMIQNIMKYNIVKLKDICLINPDTGFNELILKNEKVSFLPMEAISSNGADFYPQDRMASDYKGFTKFQDNDLLWAKITPCMQNKKSVVVKNLKNGLGFGSTEFFVIRIKDKEEADIHFILHFLRMDSVIENAKLHFKGSAGQQRVPREFLENLQIPLPPLEIQQKMIDFVESKRNRMKANQNTIQSLQDAMDIELKELIIAEK